MPADQYQSGHPVSPGIAGDLEVPIPIEKTWKDSVSFYLHLLMFMQNVGLLIFFIHDIMNNGWRFVMGSFLVLMTASTALWLLLLIFQLWRREAETCWLTADGLVWDIGFARALVPLLWISKIEPARIRLIPQSFFLQQWVIISLIQRPRWEHSHKLSWLLHLIPSTLPGHSRSLKFGNALVILPLNIEYFFDEIEARAPQLYREGNVLTADPAGRVD